MSTAVAKRKVEDAPAPSLAVSETAAIFSMIERISAQPDIPVERVEQLFGLYQKMQADRARQAYYAAFAEMQPHLPVVGKRGKGHNATYAKWEDIVSDIAPVIARHGFAISFRTKVENGKITVTGILSHRDGHAEETTLELPSDTSGNKNAIQAIGSTTSYGKRYTACSLLNVVARDEDDDGKSGGALNPISDEQEEDLRTLITETKTDINKFLEYAKAESLSDIVSKDFQKLKATLMAKKRSVGR